MIKAWLLRINGYEEPEDRVEINPMMRDMEADDPNCTGVVAGVFIPYHELIPFKILAMHMKELDPEIVKLVDENFWELLA